MQGCTDTSWLFVFAGLTPWVQAVAISGAGLCLAALIQVIGRLIPRRISPVELVHYTATEDSAGRKSIL